MLKTNISLFNGLADLQVIQATRFKNIIFQILSCSVNKIFKKEDGKAP